MIFDLKKSASLGIDAPVFQTGYLLSSKELAPHIGVTPNCLAVWRSRGEGPPYIQLVPGGTVRYKASAVKDWYESKTIDPENATRNALKKVKNNLQD